jgi:hypothetical protein
LPAFVAFTCIGALITSCLDEDNGSEPPTDSTLDAKAEAIAAPVGSGTVTFELYGTDDPVILRQSSGVRRVDMVNGSSGVDAGQFVIQENFHQRGFFADTYSCLWATNEDETVEVHCDAGFYSGEDPIVKLLSLLEGAVIEQVDSQVVADREASCFLVATTLGLQAASSTACVDDAYQLPVRMVGSEMDLNATAVTTDVTETITPDFARVTGFDSYSSTDEELGALLLPAEVR